MQRHRLPKLIVRVRSAHPAQATGTSHRPVVGGSGPRATLVPAWWRGEFGRCTRVAAFRPWPP